jgi:cell wall-associated NlpC family hydrolase
MPIISGMVYRLKNTLLALLSVTLLTQLWGCASGTTTTVSNQSRAGVQINTANASGQAASTASRMVGNPYKYGGTTPKGFDCSGLVYYSYQQAGVTVPRTSKELYKTSRRINLNDARPGDLLFFSSRRKVDHVAIYLGGDEFVHAPSSGKTVTIGRLSKPYYQEHFVAAGRMGK